MMYRLRVQNPTLDQCRPSHLPVKLASNLCPGLHSNAKIAIFAKNRKNRRTLKGAPLNAFISSYYEKMSKANKIEWSNIDGALPKPKCLHLEKDDVDSLYHCPIQLCEHEGFQSLRGCRKHVNNKHSWFFYFDEKPHVDLKLAANSSKMPTKSCASSTVVDDVSSTRSEPHARSMPSFSSSSQIGEQFMSRFALKCENCYFFEKSQKPQNSERRSFKCIHFLLLRKNE